MTFVISKSIILLTIILQFIATALLAFLLLSCIDTSSNYSNVYLIDYKFNSSSSLYQHLTIKSNSTTLNDLDDISIKVGYLGVCLSIKDDLKCTTYKTLNSIPSYTLNFLSNQFNLLQIAQTFETIIHPHLLMSCIFLTLACLLILCYILLPLPGRIIMNKIGLFISFINLMLWGLGSMLQVQSCKTAINLLSDSSFGLISSKIGTRAEIMTWIAFSFNFVVFLCMLLSNWIDFRARKVVTSMGKV
ncbi:uncharacterized protein KGF55_002817 [Candida pseudojiufengensis]|uniref:uncharacterized protein n=1 Tax=Candida pseudojiufengensis TaxID=497109 RepID=UPI0022241A93|nr:uncharacterized protein KGF55_002817 [Candida pseudojiufengensis]KAI5963025.1 hypothetical protein KGF55_002817 [Candida pseudojiufengensis]